MAKSNPNGANQYQLDARQKLCWDFYTNPNGETFGNAKTSAIKAGYTDGSADTITLTDWFCGRLWRLNSVMKGEEKMKELMELPLKDVNDRVDVGIARIQADLAKYLTTTQGKNEGYSSRTELTGANGEAIQVQTLTEEDKEHLSSLLVHDHGSTQ